jgi:hypothetical protein
MLQDKGFSLKIISEIISEVGSKLRERFKKEIVKENKFTVVIKESGRTVHKSLIKSE